MSSIADTIELLTVQKRAEFDHSEDVPVRLLETLPQESSRERTVNAIDYYRGRAGNVLVLRRLPKHVRSGVELPQGSYESAVLLRSPTDEEVRERHFPHDAEVFEQLELIQREVGEILFLPTGESSWVRFCIT